jgi:diaminopimelate decarboxylase
VLSYRDGRLFLHDTPVEAVAARHGTPVFVISEARLRDNYERLRRGLAQAPSGAHVRYCVKTNNEAGVLSLLAEQGAPALVSHPAELELALACGFPASRLAYQRPVVTEEEADLVAGSGVGRVHAFADADLGRLEEAARRHARPVHVLLRIRNEAITILNPLGFLTRRLGFTVQGALAAAERLAASPWLRLAGLNFYVGTQQESPRRYRVMLRQAAALAARIRERTGVAVEEIDLGGGAPSPSLRRIRAANAWRRVRDRLRGEESPDALDAFARALAFEFTTAVEKERLSPAPALGLEPGRGVVGNAGVLVTRVRARRGRWLFLDASHNHLGESLLLFVRAVWPEREAAATPRRRFHLAGATLNTRDVLDLGRRLPDASPGDLLVLADAGAYSIARATRYAGLPPAVCLLRKDGTLETIRRAEGYPELSASMAVPMEKEARPA